MAQERRTQDYSFAGGLGNINPAEMPEESIQKYRETLDEQIKALQKRYEEPNYWKVAAGFAKPQLGGFLASLGSASEAMGENVERQREQQLPIAQMKVQMEQANMLLSQKQKQNDIYQDWLAKNTGPDGKVAPMDASTYSRITSLGSDTPVAKAALAYYEGAKAGLDITTQATTAMGKDPMLQLEDWAKFQLTPNADPKAAQSKQAQFEKALEAGRPPQIDPAQWATMGRYEKMEQAAEYAREQREKGMSIEEVMRQKADTAPDRLKLLGSIRDLSLGVGVPEATVKDGRKLSGQEQMAALLDMFGGNNPMEVFARAMADNKGPALLSEMDKYARQYGMSEEVRPKFQTLVKLLAENQVALRGSAVNPTNAYTDLQQSASPNIGNSQTALVTLVDLMAHGEKAAQERYKFAKEKKIPYGRLEDNEEYLDLRKEQAKKYRDISTANPIMRASESTYNPAGGNVTNKPAAAPSASNLSYDAIKAERAKRDAAKKQNP
jgi:hypothetical protein